MAAPAGTECRRPAASAAVGGRVGAAAERIHAAAGVVVAAAAAAPAAPRGSVSRSRRLYARTAFGGF